VLWGWVLNSFLRNGIGALTDDLGVRPADRSDAEEHELANVVEEMALAAGVVAPELRLTDAGLSNAAAYGRSPDEATIVVSRRMLDRLDRSQTQAGVGHLIGSVGNGDLRLLNTLLAVFVTYALAPALLTPFLRRSRRQLAAVLRAIRHRDDPGAEARAVRQLLAPEEANGFISSLIFITWTLTSLVTNLFFVGPLLLAPFRTRRYLADATAVQLTRDADALGRALADLQDADQAVPAPARYTAPHFLLEPMGSSADDLGADVGLAYSFHPSVEKRLRRLRALGYRDPGPRPERHGPGHWLVKGVAYAIFAVVLGPLLLVIALLALTLVATCVALALLFVLLFAMLVVTPLHLWLRSLA
jgi:Zn-dependent protease with chaperone function